MQKKLICLVMAACLLLPGMTAGAAESRIEGEEDVTLEPAVTDPEGKQVGSDGMVVVTLDPGHGGKDPGAVAEWDGKTIQEKDLNLKIALYCKAELEQYAGVTVSMTRTGDSYIGLADRVTFAEQQGADIIVSLHNNATDGTTQDGAMMLVSNGNYRPELAEITQDIGSRLLEKLEAMGLRNLGFLRRNSASQVYPNGTTADYYSIIRNATLRNLSGMIIEHAFLDNYQDYSRFLSTDAQLQALGIADAQAIAEAYGLKRRCSSADHGDAPFTDVYDDQWYYGAVVFAWQNRLLAGTSDTTFSPEWGMTRAMVVQTLYNAAGKPEVSGTTDFSDVQADAWYADAVCWAVEQELTAGTGDHIFEPDAIVTREQLVQFLYNHAGRPQTSGSLSVFPDADYVSEWAWSAMCWAVENGIIHGSVGPEGVVLAPGSGATRAQTAAILRNHLTGQ